MSLVASKKTMAEGDTVVLYLGYDNFIEIQLARGRVNQTRYGAIKHDRLIGAPFGVKVECPKGWIYPLQLTAELWTLSLPHRTQILYTTDISMIVFQLYLKPGSVVAEAGTGSGSLSHALIRSVMPTGHLHTFEFHEERCTAAAKQFEQHGLQDYVTTRHRDVCTNGFDLSNEVDAVFLDLPSPWECIVSAKQALRLGGRICSFSPCLEQVQKTCQVLQDNSFTDITTIECLSRPFNVYNVRLPPVDFGDDAEQDNPRELTKVDSVQQTSPPNATKVARIDSSNDRVEEAQTGDLNSKQRQAEETVKAKQGTRPEGHEFMSGAPLVVMQGHTGFLTFASIF